MTVRWEDKQKMTDKLLSDGVFLVWTSTHGNCSERCEPYQGKLYSLDHTSGVKDGIPYAPLENATDVYHTTKAGKRYKNSIISGFNCRHTLIPYSKGNMPIHVPAAVVAEQRDIEKKQRYLERQVREFKSLSLMHNGVDKSCRSKTMR